MKRLITSTTVFSFAIAMIACGGRKTVEETSITDTATVKIDTVAQKVDNALKAIVDSAKAAAK